MSLTFHDKLPNPIQKVGEHQIVKTPTALAEQILDVFPKDVWSDKNKKWLFPVSKSGVFQVLSYIRLMNGLKISIPDFDERRSWIIQEMMFSFCPTYSCELFTRRNFLGKVWNDMRGFETLKGNVETRDFLKVTLNKNGEVEMTDEDGKKKYVKFDCIVGNPPYQDNSKANDPKNLYPDFVLKAIELNPQYLSMVIPARWMMGSGKGITTFLKTMLESKKLSSISLEKNSSKWFRHDVEIKGGVMYFMYDRNHDSFNVNINGISFDLTDEDCIITDVIGLGIKTKVIERCDQTFDNVMLGGCPFGITSTHKDWSIIPDSSYVCHGSGKGISDKINLIPKSLVKRNVECIPKFKVCVAKAAGKGSDGISQSFVIEPNHIVTESYLVLCSFDLEQDADNVSCFLSTRLAQYLLSLMKNTQNVSKRVFKWLPYLDFSRSYIDQDLYTMFELTPEEIVHIETTTKDFPIFRVKPPKKEKPVKKVKTKV
jgi:site-specific DNA-methyltransferase (adenine-specific)